nr:hypothetical protein [Pseudomonas sp.]
MPRYVSLLAALVLGAAAGAMGARAWWPHEPVVVAAPVQDTQALELDMAKLQADNTLLRVDNAMLKNDIVRFQDEEKAARERHQTLQDELENTKKERLKLQANLLAAQGQLTIEQSAKEHLAQELVAVQQDVGMLQQNLAFFEQLIPENSKPAAISIRSMEVARQADTLRYHVLVMRNRPATEEFVGSLEFTATGTKGGSGATISLETAENASTSGSTADAASTDSDPTVLKFKQYQRASGFLAIPPGFEPESVTVRVLEGKSVRSEHTIGIAPKE